MSLFFGNCCCNQTPVVLPLDVVATGVAGYGLRLLRAAYSGNAIRVRRSSDSAQTDVGFSNGYVNSSSTVSAGGTFGTWAGADTIFVVSLYDQTGNGWTATQSNTALQMTYTAAADGIYPALVGTGTQYYQTSTIVTSLSGKNAVSIFFHGKTTNGVSGTNFVFEGGATNLSGIFTSNANNCRFLVREPYNNTGGDNCQSANGVIPTNTYYKFTAIKDGAGNTQSVYKNGVLQAQVAVTQAAWAEATMRFSLGVNGGSLGSGAYPGTITAWIIFYTALNSTQQAAVEGFF